MIIMIMMIMIIRGARVFADAHTPSSTWSVYQHTYHVEKLVFVIPSAPQRV